MSADVVIRSTMNRQTIVAIGGFAEAASGGYVLAVGRVWRVVAGTVPL